jgi:hypothetical protein
MLAQQVEGRVATELDPRLANDKGARGPGACTRQRAFVHTTRPPSGRCSAPLVGPRPHPRHPSPPPHPTPPAARRARRARAHAAVAVQGDRRAALQAHLPCPRDVGGHPGGGGAGEGGRRDAGVPHLQVGGGGLGGWGGGGGAQGPGRGCWADGPAAGPGGRGASGSRARCKRPGVPPHPLPLPRPRPRPPPSRPAWCRASPRRRRA